MLLVGYNLGSTVDSETVIFDIVVDETITGRFDPLIEADNLVSGESGLNLAETGEHSQNLDQD